MDILWETANYYSQNLAGKKFLLTAGKKGKTISLVIYFGEENFHHLIGLHKLKDIPAVQRKKRIVYRQILTKKTTISDIEKSICFSQIIDRLESFNKMIDVLFAPNALLKSLKGEFKGVEADFLLTKKDEKVGNIHLFLKGDEIGITIPISFFCRADDTYIKNNIPWTVLSVAEIVKENEMHQENTQDIKVIKVCAQKNTYLKSLIAEPKENERNNEEVME